MRKKMPTITESATELHQRMKQATDVKQRQSRHVVRNT
jgi:hypothetical protein